MTSSIFERNRRRLPETGLECKGKVVCETGTSLKSRVDRGLGLFMRPNNYTQVS